MCREELQIYKIQLSTKGAEHRANMEKGLSSAVTCSVETAIGHIF